MIKYVFIGLIMVIVLSYFGYDLKAIIEAPTTQSNLGYTWSGITWAWDQVKGPVTYLYNNIFLGILWQAFINNLGRINAGAPTELQNAVNRFTNIGNTGYVPIDQGQ